MKDEPLLILVLHKMGDPRQWRKAVQEHEFLLPICAPEHHYLVHSSEVPLPSYIKDIDFDAIILGPTFLCNRYKKRHLHRIKNIYSFIKDSKAYKIALPQDDYNCCDILDEWLTEWGVDVTYPVIDDHWDLLYPKLTKAGKLRLGYTGYIHDEWINQWQAPKPFDKRGVDVSYRSGKLAPSFGRIGHEKATIGERFMKAVKNERLVLDISTSEKDMIPGHQWHHFIENSKFCLGSNSGSSLIDRTGDLRQKTNRYLATNPEASFEEVEKHCFPGEDGKWILTAISPRVMEAALAQTVQILTPGTYSGILEPNQHYIPLEPDCSNVSDVLAQMRDKNLVAKIASQCKERILSCGCLRATEQARSLIDQIKERQSTTFKDREHSINLINRYQNESQRLNDDFWKTRRMLKKFVRTAKRYGAQRIINFLNI